MNHPASRLVTPAVLMDLTRWELVQLVQHLAKDWSPETLQELVAAVREEYKARNPAGPRCDQTRTRPLCPDEPRVAPGRNRPR